MLNSANTLNPLWNNLQVNNKSRENAISLMMAIVQLGLSSVAQYELS